MEAGQEVMEVEDHGCRRSKVPGPKRKVKGVEDYAAEHKMEFTSRLVGKDGQLVRVLICRYCCQSVGARSDRINEHLNSKRHKANKEVAFHEAEEAGRNLVKEFEDESKDSSSFRGLAIPAKLHLTAFAAKILTSHSQPTKNMPRLKPNPKLKRKPVYKSQTHFRILWSNYPVNTLSVFSKMRLSGHLCDVKLFCEGKTINCHRLVLAAGSTYFETLFTTTNITTTPNSFPVVFLRDMEFWVAEALVDFMYKGEVIIPQEKLQALLRAAESMEVKGLCSSSTELVSDVGFEEEAGARYTNSTSTSGSCGADAEDQEANGGCLSNQKQNQEPPLKVICDGLQNNVNVIDTANNNIGSAVTLSSNGTGSERNHGIQQEMAPVSSFPNYWETLLPPPPPYPYSNNGCPPAKRLRKETPRPREFENRNKNNCLPPHYPPELSSGIPFQPQQSIGSEGTQTRDEDNEMGESEDDEIIQGTPPPHSPIIDQDAGMVEALLNLQYLRRPQP